MVRLDVSVSRRFAEPRADARRAVLRTAAKQKRTPSAGLWYERQCENGVWNCQERVPDPVFARSGRSDPEGCRGRGLL